MTSVVPIHARIHTLRGCKVMLDVDLASLYGVDVRRLNQAVKRNRARFPADFMFQLRPSERPGLRSQTVISSAAHGGRRYLPYAFTEQGVAMLSGLLRTPRAIAANIQIMRAFVYLRRLLVTHTELARKLAELEVRYDGQFKIVFDAIRRMMAPSMSTARRIGFRRP
jgi:hypothetical protein